MGSPRHLWPVKMFCHVDRRTGVKTHRDADSGQRGKDGNGSLRRRNGRAEHQRDAKRLWTDRYKKNGLRNRRSVAARTATAAEEKRQSMTKNRPPQKRRLQQKGGSSSGYGGSSSDIFDDQEWHSSTRIRVSAPVRNWTSLWFNRCRLASKKQAW